MAAATSLLVVAELAGASREARLERLAGGEQLPLAFDFPPALPRPGSHALTLLIDYQPEEPAGAARRSERACVLLPLGADPRPAIAVRSAAPTLDTTGTLELSLESRDGEPHPAALRLLPPYGINVLDAPERIAVPAHGAAVASVRLIRGAAARSENHRILFVVRALDGPLERTTLASAEVAVAPDPAWLPRLRPALVALGLLLLLGAAALELERRRRA